MNKSLTLNRHSTQPHRPRTLENNNNRRINNNNDNKILINYSNHERSTSPRKVSSISQVATGLMRIVATLNLARA